MIIKPDDMYALNLTVNVLNYSPQKMMSVLSPILSSDVNKNNMKSLFEENKLVYTKNFSSIEEYNAFVKFWIKNFYSPDSIHNFRIKMKQYFLNIIGENDATFDVGYSGRTESLLSLLLGRKIDAYYVHFINDRALSTSKYFNFGIKTFLDYCPIVTGTIRETIMSEMGPSCIGYKVDDGGNISIHYGNFDMNYQSRFCLSNLQKSAVSFTQDMFKIFGKDIQYLYYQKEIASLPLEYFLNYSLPYDRYIFSTLDFEDDVYIGKNVNALTFWKKQTEGILQSEFMLGYTPRWKRVIFFALFDRKTLKEKVKKKFARHPVLLKFMKVGYSIPRGIFHVLHR